MQPTAGGCVDVPILHVAIEEQLGLKLERRRGDVEVLVIDAVVAGLLAGSGTPRV
jgi:uncharacterized protein (TIGR03435 family)